MLSLLKGFNQQIKASRYIEQEIAFVCGQFKDLIVVDTKKLRGISPQLASELTSSTGNIRKALNKNLDVQSVIKDFNEYKKFRNVGGGAKGTKLSVLNKTVGMIGFDEEQSAIKALRAVSHEAGHLLTEKGFPKDYDSLKDRNLAENAADIYAYLKLKKYFSSDYYLSDNKSACIVLKSNPIPYTFNGLEAVNEMSKNVNFSKISNKMLIALADHLAVKHSPSESVLNKLTEAYRPVAQDYKARNVVDFITVKKIIKVVADHLNDIDICNLGMQFLKKEGLNPIKHSF